jgi:hypothetical protein
LPLNGFDNALHAGTALVAFVVYFTAPATQEHETGEAQRAWRAPGRYRGAVFIQVSRRLLDVLPFGVEHGS